MGKTNNRLKIKKKIRSTVSGSESKPRFTVFKSNKAIYAQLVNDADGKTLVSCSTLQVEAKGTKTEVSKEVGKKLAEKASSAGIKDVVFDRNGYIYHGRIKALADGAREGGLVF